jgi:hypothetical protein
LKRPKTGFFIPVREWLAGAQAQRFADRGLRGWARYVYESSGGAGSRTDLRQKNPQPIEV